MAMFRARVDPRVAAIVLIIGALIVIAPLPATGLMIEAALIWLGVSCLKRTRALNRAGWRRNPAASAVEDYLSRTIVTGPSFVSATSIIAPKEPAFTDLTPTRRSFSQK